MGAILQAVMGFFVGDVGAKVGGAVANVGTLAAILAAIAPVALWFLGHKDDTFITISYGEVAFWFSLLFGLVAVVIKVAHLARSPGQ